MPAVKLNLAQDELAQLADFQRRHRVSLLCLVCTELAGLAKLKQRLGDAGALRLLQQQEQVLRDLLSAYPGGLEVSCLNGGAFLVFEKPSDAVRFALELQARMTRLGKKIGQVLPQRISVHVGEMLVGLPEAGTRVQSLNGIQVDIGEALRSLAGPGQILLTRFAYDNARQSIKSLAGTDSGGGGDLVWASHGFYEVEGMEDALEVYEVAERNRAPLSPPKGNERIRRAAGSPDLTQLAPETSGIPFLQRLRTARVEERRAAGFGAALAAGLGALVLLTGWLDGPSYDLAYLLRPRVTPDEVVVVEMDQPSHLQLNQGQAGKWDRRLHAQLLDRLHAAGAKAVGFDILFDNATTPDADGQLRAALERFGLVALGASVSQGQILAPDPSLRAAAPWGIVERAIGSTTIRQPFGGYQGYPSLGQLLGKLALGKTLAPPSGAWLNYYGPPGSIARRSFAAVISNEVPAVAFSNKVVFVGANALIGFTGDAGADYFHSPHSRWSLAPIPGVEVNATSYANLVRGDWLRRFPPWVELILVLVFGATVGGGLSFLAPARALGLAAGLALLLGVSLAGQVWWSRLWFPWLVLSGLQVPLAALWAVVVRTRLLVDEDRRLRKFLATRRQEPEAATPHRPAASDGTQVMTLAEQAVAGANSALPNVPDHELLKCIGRGAYGEVWLARDIIGSYHAVKLLRRAAFKDDAPFEREFSGLQHYTPVSRSHPGLVHILHVGRNDVGGFIYYMMEAGDDEFRGPAIAPETYAPRNLSNDIERRGALPLLEVVELAIPLLEALGFLHGRGLIHRDLKPANIIFVHGRPKLADVGLVTQIAAAGQQITMIGTHGFMPPEGPGAPSADIFSLGKLLYEAIAGRSVKHFPDLPEAVMNAPESELVREFVGLLLRACEPIASERYQSATEFITDLRALRQRLPPVPGQP